MLRPKPHSKSGEESLEEQKEPFVDQALDRDEGNGPNLDIASGTRTGCIAAVSMGVILSLLCLISGIYLVTQKSILGAPVSISPAGQEAVSLVINFILALCTDGMMFVHSASLRWALYREERLEYNTNIRLFTSSKRFGPNSWYINLVALACLILTYASSSVLLVSNQAYMGNENGGVFFELMINATALIALGLGLAGQAAIAVWCLVSCQKSIPTWSSNPLNTASVALHKGDLVHRPGRCMLSVHQRTMPSQEAYPGKRQGSMFQVQHIVRYILALIWSLALLAIAWPIAIATVSRSIGNDSYLGQGFENPCWKLRFDWEKSDWACSRNFVTLSMSPTANDHNPSSPAFSYGAEAVLCILFVCLVQALQTIVLHCLELLVNLSRDEGLWRQAYRGTKEAPGTQLSTNPFLSAASSWENIVLFISKALLHWIIGQSMIASVAIEESKILNSIADTTNPGPEYFNSKYGFQFDMVYPRLLIYAIMAIVVASLGTYLALKRPRGCQPATLGHLQTIVDLIDDWATDQSGRMWWGDKPVAQLEDNQARHAGTCWDKAVLGPIQNTKYAGN